MKPLMRLVGRDADFLYFTTRSWTDPATFYDLGICARTGRVYCTCTDAVCRKRESYLLPEFDSTYNPCKHARLLLDACDEILFAEVPRDLTTVCA